MTFNLSGSDRSFAADFDNGELPPTAFRHRDHVRLAYVTLVGCGLPDALGAVRQRLLRYLAHHGIDPAKYHETLTQAWVRAVRHFMDRSTNNGNGAADFDDFIGQHPRLLDSSIMQSHYSVERLASPPAKTDWVEPDRAAIPPPVAGGHGAGTSA